MSLLCPVFVTSKRFRSRVPVMPGREERVVRNEVIARRINEGIEEAQEEAQEGEPSEPFIRVLCECGRDRCDRVIAITVLEYERIRSSPLQFAVLRDHVIGDVERIVEKTDRFVVVVKHEGIPAQVAAEEDPRS